MIDGTWYGFINWLCFCFEFAWCMSAIAINISRKFAGGHYHKWLGFIFSEIKPFYLTIVIINIAILSMSGELLRHPYSIWESFVWLCCWWVYKDTIDDDDRWKKRKKKVLDKVKRLGSKLVVVPNN